MNDKQSSIWHLFSSNMRGIGINIIPWWEKLVLSEMAGLEREIICKCILSVQSLIIRIYVTSIVCVSIIITLICAFAFKLYI